MPRFRKKPVVIEAWHNIADGEPMPKWVAAALAHPGPIAGTALPLDTLEGILAGSPGDWIIQGVKGEVYSCREDIFNATYEPAE